jgi:hypothetical protein
MTSKCSEAELLAVLAADNNISCIVICDDIAYDVTSLTRVIIQLQKFFPSQQLGPKPDPTDFDAMHDYLSQNSALFLMGVLSQTNDGPFLFQTLKEALNTFLTLPVTLDNPPPGPENNVQVFVVKIIDCSSKKTLDYWQDVLSGLC